MGDVTIYLLLDSSLLGNSVNEAAKGTSEEVGLFQFQSSSHILPADSSLAELMHTLILPKIKTSNNDSTSSQPSAENNADERGKLLESLTILDISYNPAKIISPIVRQYTQVSGPNSKTLHSLGWYPSGKLVILPSPSQSSSFDDESIAGTDVKEEADTTTKEEQVLLDTFLMWQSRNVLQHEEFAYNNPDAANKYAGIKSDDVVGKSSSDGVQWTGVGAPTSTAQGNNATMKPSDIFNAVEQRSENDDILVEQQLQTTKPKKKKPKRTEQERTKRLDTLLLNLESKSKQGNKTKKKKAVSEKVRTMLLKSRSEGNKKLRMEDRFHLEVVRLYDVVEDTSQTNKGDGDDTTSYRFFSRQTTAGRVASTVASNLGNTRASELLVLCNSQEQKQNDEKRYRRLPNTMSLNDAERSGWIKDFDVVVVRIYSLAGKSGGTDNEEGGYGPSKSVLDPDSDVEMESDNDDENEGGKHQQCTFSECNTPSAIEVEKESTEAKPKQSTEQSQQKLQERMHTIFQSLDESNNPKKKKKKPTKQMQHMLMKSKSSGNSRIKQEDRVYLEVITFQDNGADIIAVNTTSLTIASSYRFFSRQNDLQHIITVCCGDESKDANVEFIVSRSVDNDEANVVYRSVPAGLTLGEAIQKGCVEEYGRV